MKFIACVGLIAGLLVLVSRPASAPPVVRECCAICGSPNAAAWASGPDWDGTEVTWVVLAEHV
jgi:hypothetical protein